MIALKIHGSHCWIACGRHKGRPAAASCVDQKDENNHMGRLCTRRSFICPTRASPGSRARRMATRLRGTNSRRHGRSGTGRLLAHQVSRIRRDHNGRRGSLRRIPASKTHELRAAAARPIASAPRQNRGTNCATLSGKLGRGGGEGNSQSMQLKTSGPPPSMWASGKSEGPASMEPSAPAPACLIADAAGTFANHLHTGPSAGCQWPDEVRAPRRMPHRMV